MLKTSFKQNMTGIYLLQVMFGHLVQKHMEQIFFLMTPLPLEQINLVWTVLNKVLFKVSVGVQDKALFVMSPWEMWNLELWMQLYLKYLQIAHQDKWSQPQEEHFIQPS